MEGGVYDVTGRGDGDDKFVFGKKFHCFGTRFH